MKSFEQFLEEHSSHRREEFVSHKAWKKAATDQGYQITSSGKHSYLTSRAAEASGLQLTARGEFKPDRVGGKPADHGKGFLEILK